MADPTTHQLRALELFQFAAALPEQYDLVRAAVVANCLIQEGIEIKTGWAQSFHNSYTDKETVFEFLEIDGALVDAKGIYQTWDDVDRVNALPADAPVKDPPEFRPGHGRGGGPPGKFNPHDISWLKSTHAQNLFNHALGALVSLDQQKVLNTSSPQAAARRAARL